MSFMQKEVYKGHFFKVETTHGTEVVPSDVIGRTCATHAEALLDYLEGTPVDGDELCPLDEGWVGRLQAPGYLDCTAWSAWPSETAAHRALDYMLGED